MKIVTVVIKVLLILVILTPILGLTGVFPAPTADLYTPAGWAFMGALLATGYMTYLIALLCLVCIVLLLLKKDALAAALLAPFALNVLCFHLFLDGGIFKPDAILAWILVLADAYFLYTNRKKYKTLW